MKWGNGSRDITGTVHYEYTWIKVHVGEGPLGSVRQNYLIVNYFYEADEYEIRKKREKAATSNKNPPVERRKYTTMRYIICINLVLLSALILSIQFISGIFDKIICILWNSGFLRRLKNSDMEAFFESGVCLELKFLDLLNLGLNLSEAIICGFTHALKELELIIGFFNMRIRSLKFSHRFRIYSILI